MGIDKERGATARTGKEMTATVKDGRAELRTGITPRSVVIAEFNRMIGEIDASAMMQEELRMIDPTPASASSFFSVVTGGAGRKKNAKEAKGAEVAHSEAKYAEVVRSKAKGAEVAHSEAKVRKSYRKKRKMQASYLEDNHQRRDTSKSNVLPVSSPQRLC